MLAQTANAIPEFKCSIKDGQVVEHEVVHPSSTLLADEDLFGFCMMDYRDNFSELEANTVRKLTQVKQHPTLKDPPGMDNLRT